MTPVPFHARLVLLGASNLARDFPLVLRCAGQTLTEAPGGGDPTGPLQVFSACGHGRSYGSWSRVFFLRGLPGITRCGLWPALEAAVADQPEIPTYALLTDIGNDIAYGALPEDVSQWVETCLQRLSNLGSPVTLAMTLLPLASLRRLSRWKFEILRLLFFPTHRTTYEQVRQRTEELQDRLRELADRLGVPALEPDPAWLGPDHIHLRLGARRRAWREILGLWNPHPGHSTEREPAVRLPRLLWWTLTPERWTLAGIPLGRRQPAARFRDGSEIRLF